MGRQVHDTAGVATADFGKRKELDIGAKTIANSAAEETGMELDRPQSFMSAMSGYKTFLHLGLDRPRLRDLLSGHSLTP